MALGAIEVNGSFAPIQVRTLASLISCLRFTYCRSTVSSVATSLPASTAPYVQYSVCEKENPEEQYSTVRAETQHFTVGVFPCLVHVKEQEPLLFIMDGGFAGCPPTFTKNQAKLNSNPPFHSAFDNGPTFSTKYEG